MGVVFAVTQFVWKYDCLLVRRAAYLSRSSLVLLCQKIFDVWVVDVGIAVPMVGTGGGNELGFG